jgi:hypothetical protein
MSGWMKLIHKAVRWWEKHTIVCTASPATDHRENVQHRSNIADAPGYAHQLVDIGVFVSQALKAFAHGP